MRAKLRTAAISASALMVVGGAAAAYVTATSVSGNGTAATTTNDYRVRLAAHQSNIPVMSTSPYNIPVLGKNLSTTTSVRLRAGSVAAPVIEVNEAPGAPVCPDGSFTVGAPVDYTERTLEPLATDVVAQLPVFFHYLPDQSQNGCVGATLTFEFPLQAVPAA